MTIAPVLDRETLTSAHVTLCELEKELRTAGRGQQADMLSYVDLLVLMIRNKLTPVRVEGGTFARRGRPRCGITLDGRQCELEPGHASMHVAGGGVLAGGVAWR